MELPLGKLLFVKNCDGEGWESEGCLGEEHPWVRKRGENPANWGWYWCPGSRSE